MPADNQETFSTIQQWAWDTFRKADPERTIERAGEEWDEMLSEHFIGERSLVAEEAADVIITLLNLEGVPEAIQAKMQKNRARRWQVMGDGTGYHIKETVA